MGTDLTPQQQNILVQLRGVIAQQLGVDEATVTPGATFVGDLDADPLDMIQLAMEVQEKFSVALSDDLPGIVTVRDLLEYISQRQV